MKRWTTVPALLGMILLAWPNVCLADTAVCSPPELLSYVIVNEHDLLFKLRGICRTEGGSATTTENYYIDARWKATVAEENVEVNSPNKPRRSARMISHCSQNPWLTDGGTCTHEPFDQKAQDMALFMSLGPDTRYPLSWNAIPPDKKVQIGTDIEHLKAKSAAPPKTLPTDPPKIMLPMNNQYFYGIPAQISFRILHDPAWTVKYEFLADTKLGNSSTWVPQPVTLRDQNTIDATGDDGVTPVKITSGEATLATGGLWKIHVWYDCPGSTISSWTNITVKPVEPITKPKREGSPGWIKIQ